MWIGPRSPPATPLMWNFIRKPRWGVSVSCWTADQSFCPLFTILVHQQCQRLYSITLHGYIIKAIFPDQREISMQKACCCLPKTTLVNGRARDVLCLVFLLLVLESCAAISICFANWHPSTFSVHAQAARNTTAGEEAPSHMLRAELPMACVCSGSSKQNKTTPSNQLCSLMNRSAE